MRTKRAVVIAAIFLSIVGFAILARSVLLTSSIVTLPSVVDGQTPCEWYYADGIIQPDGISPQQARKGIWSASKEWITLFNLSSRSTRVTATFYFEDMPPRTTTRTLPALSPGYIIVHEIPDVVPPCKQYGVCVQSESPVIVQPTRGEYEPYNPVTQAMASFVAYPGPLGKKETKWAYADGIVLSSASPLEEREWISILNPNQVKDAAIEIVFYFGRKHVTYDLKVPAQRIRTVDLFALESIPKNVHFAAVIQSDIPVVVEEVRRAYTKGIPHIASMFACIAHAIGQPETDIAALNHEARSITK